MHNEFPRGSTDARELNARVPRSQGRDGPQ